MDTTLYSDLLTSLMVAGTEPPVIETRSLTKINKGNVTLKSLDLHVQQNSICGFLGPNGAGKTTTIKLLLGFARPTGGFGQVFGLDIRQESEEIRRRVGYLAQDPRYYEYLSATGWIEAMSLVYLNLLFYLTSALMLATLFQGRGPILVICLIVQLTGLMTWSYNLVDKYIPWLIKILPWDLLADNGGNSGLAMFLAVGKPLPTVLPIIATALWCV